MSKIPMMNRKSRIPPPSQRTTTSSLTSALRYPTAVPVAKITPESAVPQRMREAFPVQQRSTGIPLPSSSGTPAQLNQTFVSSPVSGRYKTGKHEPILNATFVTVENAEPLLSDSFEAVSPPATHLSQSDIGQPVCVRSQQRGILRYFGKTEFADGIWCGIEFPEPVGKNNGCVNNVRYFDCPDRHGIFAPVSIVVLARDDVVPPRLRQGTTAGQRSQRSPTKSRLVMPKYNSKLDCGRTLRDLPTEVCDAKVSSLNNTFSCPPVDDTYDINVPHLNETFSSGDHLQVCADSTFSFPTATSPMSTSVECRRDSVDSSKRDSADIDRLLSEISKHSSFEMDESFGILTSEQMKEFTVCGDSTTSGRTPSFEDIGPMDDEVAEEACRIAKEITNASLDDEAEEHVEVDDVTSQPRVDDALDPYESPVSGGPATSTPQAMDSDGLLQNVSPPSEVTPNSSRFIAWSKPSQGSAGQELLSPVVENSANSESVFENDDGRCSPDEGHGLKNVTFECDQKSSPICGGSVDIEEESASDVEGDRLGSLVSSVDKKIRTEPSISASITSITTSVTSIDTGYQGDAEFDLRSDGGTGTMNSPTEEMGTLGQMTGVDVNDKLSVDVMTDSDFCSDPGAALTESEHDDIVPRHRGARVIDGRLYSPRAKKPPLKEEQHSEMESSGVFSDVERKNEENQHVDVTVVCCCTEVPSQQQNNRDSVHSDSGTLTDNTSTTETDGTTEHKTGVHAVDDDHKLDVDIMQLQDQENDAKEILNSQGTPMTKTAKQNTPKSTPRQVPKKKDSSQRSSSSKKQTKDDSTKKPKMPKKNVESKIKAMIESPSAQKQTTDGENLENQENRRPVRAPKKSRWDAVMDKIAQGQAEEKHKPKKEVKGKVFANFVPPPPAAPRTNKQPVDQTARSPPKKKRSKTNPDDCDVIHSSSSDLTGEPKTDFIGIPLPPDGDSTERPQSPSQLSDTSTVSAHSGTSSSRNKMPVGKRSVLRPVPLSTGSNTSLKETLKKSKESGSASSVGRPTTRRIADAQSRTSVRTNNQKNASHTEDISGAGLSRPTGPSTRVPLAPRTINKRTAGKDQSRVKNSSSSNTPTRLQQLLQSRDQHISELTADLKHNQQGFSAMTVLLQYLTEDLDAFSAPGLRCDISQLKQELVQSRLLVDESQASAKQLEDRLLEERQDAARRVAELQGQQEKLLAEMHEEKRRHEEDRKCLAAQQQEDLSELHHQHTTQLRKVEEAHREEVAQLEARQREELTRLEELAARKAEEWRRKEADQEEVTRKFKEDADLLRVKVDHLTDTLVRDSDSREKIVNKKTAPLLAEIESLRVVLEMRNTELREYKQLQAEHALKLEELSNARDDIHRLNALNEDLQAQIQKKVESERSLTIMHQSLVEEIDKKSRVNLRLSMEKEELQFRLRNSMELSNLSYGVTDPVTNNVLSNGDPFIVNCKSPENPFCVTSPRVLVDCHKSMSPVGSPHDESLTGKQHKSLGYISERSSCKRTLSPPSTPICTPSTFLKKSNSPTSSCGDFGQSMITSTPSAEERTSASGVSWTVSLDELEVPNDDEDCRNHEPTGGICWTVQFKEGKCDTDDDDDKSSLSSHSDIVVETSGREKVVLCDDVTYTESVGREGLVSDSEVRPAIYHPPPIKPQVPQEGGGETMVSSISSSPIGRPEDRTPTPEDLAGPTDTAADISWSEDNLLSESEV